MGQQKRRSINVIDCLLLTKRIQGSPFRAVFLCERIALFRCYITHSGCEPLRYFVVAVASHSLKDELAFDIKGFLRTDMCNFVLIVVAKDVEAQAVVTDINDLFQFML